MLRLELNHVSKSEVWEHCIAYGGWWESLVYITVENQDRHKMCVHFIRPSSKRNYHFDVSLRIHTYNTPAQDIVQISS